MTVPLSWLATAVLVVLAPALVVVLCVAEGYVVSESKWPIILPRWSPANLLPRCVAEAVLYRELLQRYLAQALRRAVPWGGNSALLVSTAASGIERIGGGVSCAVLGGITGFGLGVTNQVTQLVEASIGMQFSAKLTRLLPFTYPSLAAQ